MVETNDDPALTKMLGGWGSALFIRRSTIEEQTELMELIHWIAENDDYPHLRDAIKGNENDDLDELRVKGVFIPKDSEKGSLVLNDEISDDPIDDELRDYLLAEGVIEKYDPDNLPKTLVFYNKEYLLTEKGVKVAFKDDT